MLTKTPPQRDFFKLLTGQTVSLFGSLISRLALPFLIIYTFSASPMQMAWLRVLELVPCILVGLLAGVMVDRTLRRTLMLVTDLGRALLMGSIPLLFLAHHLSLPVIMVIAGLMSMASMLFDSAYDAYLPTIVPAEQLIDANAKLSAMGSVSEVAGFGIAGVLFNLIGGAFTFSFDAVSFLVSAWSLWTIRSQEPTPHSVPRTEPLIRDLSKGLSTILKNPLLFRALLMDGTTSVFFGLSGTVYMLFVSRVLHLGPIVQGILYAVGGMGSLVTAGLTNKLVGRLGHIQILILGTILAAMGTLLLPLAFGPIWILVLFVLGQQIFGDGGDTLLIIGLDSLRQLHSSNAMLGRIRSTWLVSTSLGMVLGTLAGGQLAQFIGLRDTLFVGVGIRLGVIAIALWSRSLMATTTDANPHHSSDIL